MFMSPSDRVAQLYPQAPGSLYVAVYDSQGYGGGTLTRLHTLTGRDQYACASLSKMYMQRNHNRSSNLAVCLFFAYFICNTT
jgi:hypothetical protein